MLLPKSFCCRVQRKTRVRSARLVVKLFGGCRIYMIECRRNDAYVFRIVNRDRRRQRIAEQVRVLVLSELRPRTSGDGIINAVLSHGSRTLGDPKFRPLIPTIEEHCTPVVQIALKATDQILQARSCRRGYVL
jgi:hypothetical protein